MRDQFQPPAGVRRLELDLAEGQPALLDFQVPLNPRTATDPVKRAPARCRQSFRHEAFFWREPNQFTDHLVPFVRGGIEADEPVLLLLTSEHAQWMCDKLGSDAAQVAVVDIADLGRNPARIIPVIHAFMDGQAGQPARAISEPVRPGRRPEEVTESQLHEALINLAVEPDLPLWLICPYDADRLEPALIQAAQRSHPILARTDSYQGSACYGGYPYADALATAELPSLARYDEAALTCDDVPAATQIVTLAGANSGLRSDQILRLNQAIRGLLADSAGRDAATVTIRTSDTPAALIIDVIDTTTFDDLLLGRRTANGTCQDHLSLVNATCDLVQTRSTSSGTTVRVHSWK